MSTAFVYGGIEKRTSIWPGQGDFPQGHSQFRDSDQGTNTFDRNGRSSKEGYINGGLDRSNVSWTRADD